jgi:hypothetical protein
MKVNVSLDGSAGVGVGVGLLAHAARGMTKAIRMSRLVMFFPVSLPRQTVLQKAFFMGMSPFLGRCHRMILPKPSYD